MNVLVIDDDPVFATLVREMVIDAGHNAKVANSGEAGLTCYKIRPFDILICDWAMPGISGIDVCRKIRELPSQNYTYFIILTGEKTTRDHYVTAMKNGADDLLVKPVDAETLMFRLAVAAPATPPTVLPS
ncbi:MAG: Response regulator receiver protein [Parcubacteria group bacterium GW2011_GWF2_50_9]|nr:MAG: Response regulator receiver protein [Parcubacteria group bacterium GW2011_GWF2_50_9]